MTFDLRDARDVANSDGGSAAQEASRGWRGRLTELLVKPGRSSAASLNETPDGTGRGQSGAPSDIAQQAARQLAAQRSKLLRTVIQRADGDANDVLGIPDVRVTGMQKWEGRVVEVDDDYFSVDLVPFGDGAEVTADFDRSLLSKGDDVQVGDVVYVTARTVGSKNGGLTRTSAVRLRRLGKWTEAEISEQTERAKKGAAELASYLE